ncbi:SGNH/GDSL hydrolase family protein [Janibacter sp. UYMM211]|uniref:SGNH/GDSL hydrolase family protein n=1 Tax=Janibacter sp. UYMM211 TaxID=3156342 RepID=UPI00339938A3
MLLNIGVVVGIVVGLEGAPSTRDSATSSSSSIDAAPTTSGTPTKRSRPSPREVLSRRESPTVVVLGGDEGVGDAGWVDRLSSVAAEGGRAVDYARLSPDDPTKYSDAVKSGAGRQLVLRNASVPGSSPSYAKNRLPFLVPKDADVVLISYQPVRAEGLSAQLSSLMRAVESQAPNAVIALVVGPDQGEPSHTQVRAAQRRWSSKQDVPSVDIGKAFDSAEGVLLVDPASQTGLTAPGADAWAQAVADFLFGRVPVSPPATTSPTADVTPDESTSVTSETSSRPPEPATTDAPPPVVTSTPAPPAPGPAGPGPVGTSTGNPSSDPLPSSTSSDPSGSPSGTEEPSGTTDGTESTTTSESSTSMSESTSDIFDAATT